LILGTKQLKFLVDVGVGKKVEEWLISNGYDVIAVRDVDPRMNDENVLRKAANEKRMVVTMEVGFA